MIGEADVRISIYSPRTYPPVSVVGASDEILHESLRVARELNGARNLSFPPPSKRRRVSGSGGESRPRSPLYLLNNPSRWV
jgi:hypothetical protein